MPINNYGGKIMKKLWIIVPVLLIAFTGMMAVSCADNTELTGSSLSFTATPSGETKDMDVDGDGKDETVIINTDSIDLVFSGNVYDLTDKHVSLSFGTGKAAIKSISGEDKEFKISITPIKTGNVTIKIKRAGIETTEKTVAIAKKAFAVPPAGEDKKPPVWTEPDTDKDPRYKWQNITYSTLSNVSTISGADFGKINAEDLFEEPYVRIYFDNQGMPETMKKGDVVAYVGNKTTLADNYKVAFTDAAMTYADILVKDLIPKYFAAADTSLKITMQNSFTLEGVQLFEPANFAGTVYVPIFTFTDATFMGEKSPIGFKGVDGENDWELFTDSKFIVFVFNGSNNNDDGFGGMQLVIQYAGDSWGWNQYTAADWTDFPNTKGELVYFVFPMSALVAYDAACTAGTGAKIILNSGFGPPRYLGAYLTDKSLVKASDAVTVANKNNASDTNTGWITKNPGLTPE